MEVKYVDPFTDFGFKKIFGEEASKPMLMDFLNALLPLQAPIIDLSFRNPEQLGRSKEDRRAVYDIYCENQLGEKFIVEMQKEKHNFFKERSIYYSAFPIVEQAEKGEWDFNLKPVFCIGILDFTFNDYKTECERREVVHLIRLKDQHGVVFYDKLTYIYLEMPNFSKKEHELETRLDKWLYFIKHLEGFDAIPKIFEGEVIFENALEKASLARLDRAGWASYEYSLKIYRDLNSVINTARDNAAREGEKTGEEKGLKKGLKKGLEKGLEEGREEGRIEGMIEGMIEGEAKGRIEMRIGLAKTLKTKGVPLDIISTSTGIVVEELREL